MTKDIWEEFHLELLGFIKTRINDSDTAEDILQEVFVKIHNNTDTLKQNSSLASWVYQITRNTIIDFYRKKKIDYSDEGVDKPLPMEIEDLNGDFIHCVKSFISQLPNKYKDILLSITYQNISQKEYAQAQNISYSAAKSRTQRAKEKLKELFLAYCSIQSDSYGNIISFERIKCSC
jgi:RNA polymerase sigma-70 factor, ECF subfamily